MYSAFFKSSLQQNKEQSPNNDVTEAIDNLIETITKNEKESEKAEKKEVKKPKANKDARTKSKK
jgi:hypothetical protein